MKFGETLGEGLVPEWKAQYVNYKAGKKLIHKVDELRLIYDKENTSDDPPPTSIGSLTGPAKKKAEDKANDRTPLLEPIEESVPPLESIDPKDSSGKVPEASTSGSAPNIDKNRLNTELNNEETGGGGKMKKRTSFLNYSLRSSNKDKQQSNFDAGKAAFVEWADQELEKVDKFYLDKESEAYEKFLHLQDQLYQLREHKLEVIDARLRHADKKKNGGPANGTGGIFSDSSTPVNLNIANPDSFYVSDWRAYVKQYLERLNRFETPSLPSTTFLKKWRKDKKDDKIGNEISLGRKSSGTGFDNDDESGDDYEYDPNYDQNRIRNGQMYLTREDGMNDDDLSMDLSIDSEVSEINRRLHHNKGHLPQHRSRDHHSHQSVPGQFHLKQNIQNHNQSRVEMQTSNSGLSTIDSDATNDSTNSNSGIVEAINSNMENMDTARRTARRDYVKRKRIQYHVPYLYARKQLKSALLEHYRSLTLLKSFRILNRTALRKITKKFDKSSGTAISEKFMSKVDHSYFQTSDLIDKLIRQVEELYIVFFDPESLDRKHSLEKLKSIAYTMNNLEIRQPKFYSSVFIVGACLGFGIPLICLGVYSGVSKTLSGELPEGRYMLQIWGGFFILISTLLLFGVNLMVFDYFKINYKFIFEFDLSSALDYTQFFVLPSCAFALFTILLWFSFNDYWPTKFPGRDWSWILFGSMIVVFMWPGKELYGSSRRWLQIALWRLLLSGFYPVEFRDFFLGDIFCSLTYTMGNISLYFCLFSHHWKGVIGNGNSLENVCGSNKSQLMGFFSTLPSIWRFLQCIRRYADSGDWFPHLANMAKYALLGLYYVLLSVYRIHVSETNRIVFIIFATLNSLYTSAWDILMDWSLLQSGSKNYLLRDNLFFKNPNYYYAAMVLDVLLRFQWVFYACFSSQIQQLAVTSFCVAMAELFRRFIWIFFRMENEHCTNVILFRASRDTPLPYKMKRKTEKAVKRLVKLRYLANNEIQNDPLLSSSQPPAIIEEGSTTSYRLHDEEGDVGMTQGNKPLPGQASGKSTLGTSAASGARLRRKSTFVTFTSALNKAHVKDFQRRKATVNLEAPDSDDDDEDAFSDAGSGKENASK